MRSPGQRVAFVHPFMFRHARGIERYTANLARSLTRTGVDVDILTWKSDNPVQWDELRSDARITTIPVSRYFTAWSSIPGYVSQIIQGGYSHLIVHFADYGESQTLTVLRLLGSAVPYSIVLHFPYSQVPRRYFTLKSKGVFERAENVVAVSAFVAEEARAFTNSDPIVISHGVDTIRFCPTPDARFRLAEELGLSSNAHFILSVSALEERKGVQWALRAMPEMRKTHPNLHYVVVGDGPYSVGLHLLSEELGVEDIVSFIGARTDTERYYQAAMVTLVLSRGEASSIVSLESLSCGTPVIASRHKPFDELIQPEWGLQVEETDVVAVTSAITSLLNDEDRRRRMGKAGRAHILRKHTWEHIARQYREMVFK